MNPAKQMLTRREILLGGTAIAVFPRGSLKEFLEKTLGPYFSRYTIGGLMAVAKNETNTAHQGVALKLLRDRMALRGFDNVVMTEDGPGTYRRPVTIDMITRHPVAAIERGSRPYLAFTTGLGSHQKLVTDNVAYIALVPDIRSTHENDFISAAARVLPKDGAIIQSLSQGTPTPTPLVRSLLVHEADHLANPGLDLLLSERSACATEIAAIEEYRRKTRDRSLDYRIDFLNKVVMHADYLNSIGKDFRNVYPGSITADALRDAAIPRETLAQYAKREIKTTYDKQLTEAINEILNPPKEIVKEEKPAAPMTKKPFDGPRNIPDVRNGDAVIEL